MGQHAIHTSSDPLVHQYACLYMVSIVTKGMHILMNRCSMSLGTSFMPECEHQVLIESCCKLFCSAAFTQYFAYNVHVMLRLAYFLVGRSC